MKWYPLIVMTTLFLLTGCNRPIQNPEQSDPIFLDIKRDAEKAMSEIKGLQPEVEKARKDFERAPIRTGQREDLQATYFRLAHQLQRATEKYRYLSLKLENRYKDVQILYKNAFD